MSCPILLQDTTGSVTLYLTQSSDDTEATGLTHSDVSVDLKKSDESSFSAKSLDGTNFTEIGDGFYELDLTASDLDTLGNLYIRVTGATINTALETVFVAESTPVNPTSPLSIPQTSLFGYIYDAEGSPVVGASVSARVLAQPSVLYSGAEGLALATALATAKTDNDGFFTISLVTGSSIDVFIPAVNYRRTLTVPGTSQNLFDIP